MTIAVPKLSVPFGFFNALNKEFGFDTDLFAHPRTTHLSSFYDKETDALAADWKGTNFVIPPSRNIETWMKKIHKEIGDGKTTVVCVLPSSTGSAWFHNYCVGHAELRLVKGRIPLDGTVNPGMKDSIIAIFGKKARKNKEKFRTFDYKTDCDITV